MANDFDRYKPDFEDEPVPIISGNNQSLLRPSTPRGLSFNKKMMAIIIAVVLTICTIALVYAFSPPAKRTGEFGTENQASEEPKNGTTDNTALMPNDLANLAESYGNLNNSANSNANAASALPETSANPVFDASAQSNPGSSQPFANSADLSDQELEAANKSGIRINLGQNQTGANNNNAMNAGQPNGGYQDPNRQTDKIAFMKSNQSGSFYSSSQIQKARSKYEVKASTIIPSVLITGINSDLPGNLSAQVRENVYDSTTGRYLLIPQGSRLVGIYDSQVTYGQTRVMVKWTRLIFPNGSSLDLEGIPGVDLSGYSGLTGKVNNHWGKLFSGVVISTLLSFGTVKATNDNNVRTESAEEIAGANMAQDISDIGSRYVERNFNVQPTIVVKPGAKFNVFVVKDFVLQPYIN